MNKAILNDTRLYLNEPKMALDFLVRNLGFVIQEDTNRPKDDIVKVYDRCGKVHEVCLHLVKHESNSVGDKLIISTSDCIQEYHQMEVKGIFMITKPYYTPQGLAFEISDYWNNRYILLEKRDYDE